MTDVAALREGLRANLSAIRGVQVSAYATSQPTPPGVQILPPAVEYDLAMARGLDRWTFIVQAFVSFSTDSGSQKLLDELLAPTGERSVKTALESDKTLGGAADGMQVTGADRPALVDRAGGGQLMLSEFTVVVHTSN